jgi:hypothetical protein
MFGERHLIPHLSLRGAELQLHSCDSDQC